MHRLTVARLNCRYLVPRDHPDPERVRRDLNEMARKDVADQCRSCLARELDPDDGSVWLIDKLRVDLSMDPGAGSAAAFWGRQIAASLVQTISRGEDGGRVIRFANRAAYLAWFLRELAQGRAWGRWYFDSFASLRSLPAGLAMREALRREPQLIEPVLVDLVREHAMDAVADYWSEADQQTLLDECVESTGPATAACLRAAMAMRLQTGSLSRGPLALFARIRERYPELSSAGTRDSAKLLYTLSALSREWGFQRVLSAALAGDVPGPANPELAAISQYLRAIMAEDRGLLLELMEHIESFPETFPNGAAADAPSTEGDGNIVSPFAGLFLLLPQLLETVGDVDNQTIYLILLACTGPRMKDADKNTAILLAANLEQPELIPPAGTLPDPGEVELLDGDQEFCNGRMPAAVLRAFTRTLPGVGKASFEYIWRNVLSGPGTITRLPGRILVRLEPRPLQIVLRMAGYYDMRFEVPWHPGTEIRVYFEEH